jgi:hypothetical protein
MMVVEAISHLAAKAQAGLSTGVLMLDRQIGEPVYRVHLAFASLRNQGTAVKWL